MKQSKGNRYRGLSCIQIMGLSALLLLVAANLARAQMLILKDSPQDTTRASQAVKTSLAERMAEKERAEAAARAAAEAYRNSPEGQAVQRRMDQDQANREAEKRMKKQAECARAKASGSSMATFWHC